VSMGEESGLSLRELAQRLEALERENEQMRSENAELRDKVAALEGLRATRRDEEVASEASEIEGRVSRRQLLSKAGVAAAGLVVAGALTQRDIRQAQAAQLIGSSDERNVSAVQGINSAGGTGVFGKGATGVRGIGSSKGVLGESTDGFGVQGTGKTGVYGTSSASEHSGVYGQHTGSSVGYGIIGDGTGADGAGVLGRNPSGVGVWGNSSGIGVRGNGNNIGVTGRGKIGVGGQSTEKQFPAVYGQHFGELGYGVRGDGDLAGVWGRGRINDGVLGEGKVGVHGQSKSGTGVLGQVTEGVGNGVEGIGRGSTFAGVSGINFGGYGGRFLGGRAQLMLVPGLTAGKPTGDHSKGELYLDLEGTLFVCVEGGDPATWRRVNTTAV
jgi:hypothetical protein